MDTVSRCSSCRALLRWERTLAGKRIPLDSAPVREGNVVLENGVALVLGKHKAAQARLDGRTLFMPHHATCPQRASYRKAKP